MRFAHSADGRFLRVRMLPVHVSATAYNSCPASGLWHSTAVRFWRRGRLRFPPQWFLGPVAARAARFPGFFRAPPAFLGRPLACPQHNPALSCAAAPHRHSGILALALSATRHGCCIRSCACTRRFRNSSIRAASARRAAGVIVSGLGLRSPPEAGGVGSTRLARRLDGGSGTIALLRAVTYGKRFGSVDSYSKLALRNAKGRCRKNKQNTGFLYMWTGSGVSILGNVCPGHARIETHPRLMGSSLPCCSPDLPSSLRSTRPPTRWKPGIPGPRNKQRIYVALPARAGLARCCAGRRSCMPLPR